MSKQNVTVEIEVPDCSICGKQIQVDQVFYKSATQHLKMVACVPRGSSQGQLIRATPEEVTIYCEACVPQGFL